MKFKSATIKNFRRFEHLTVRGIPETARLIMIAGPNGCGKSSFFDAIQVWHRGKFQALWQMDYHVKTGSPERDHPHDSVVLKFYGVFHPEQKEICYVRSAYRNDSEFQIKEIKRLGNPLDEIRIPRMIDNDIAVSKNYQRLVGQSLQDLYEQQEGKTTFTEYRKQQIGDIQEALKKLFPDLELNGLGDPMLDGTFRFTKGDSKGFAFKNLSGGEKAAFDLILDLVVARRDYDNTVFCIDEPESHMNARLQAQLLSVLYDLIPKNCQLMLATHSIGMMRRARDIEAENPGSVAFLDFGGRDFDKPQTIEPIKPTREFWKRAYDVALDDLAALVAPKQVIICEGSPKTGNPVKNHSHDARCYGRIFEAEFPETRFISMGNDREIVGDKRGLAEALLSLIDGMEVVRLIDRDDRSEAEVSEQAERGVRVLSRRNLESYLFDDEVLMALAVSEDQADKADELLAKRKDIRDARPDDPKDNLKPASGEIYRACVGILKLTQRGNDAQAFMRDTLGPLIKQDMAVYQELKHDIFGPGAKS